MTNSILTKSAVLLPLFTFLLFLNVFSQNKPDSSSENNKRKILEITYINAGGEYGFNIMLKLRRDSIFFRSDYYYDTLGRDTKYVLNKKNDRRSWCKLTKLINLSDFFNLKSGPSQAKVDGLDAEIIITTLNKSGYVILNKDNYVKIQEFLTQLEVELKKINKKLKIYIQN